MLVLAFASAGAIYEYSDTVPQGEGPLPEVDVIVCLAGARGRIGAAAGLWYRYWGERGGRHARLGQTPGNSDEVPPARRVPVLYFAGLGPTAGWSVVEPQLGGEVRAALDREQVVLETESGNTEENARWLAHYMRDRGWRRILLVTSSYHMKRARLIFSDVLSKKLAGSGGVRIETYSVAQEPFVPGRWAEDLYAARVTLVEYFKWVYYRAVWSA